MAAMQAQIAKYFGNAAQSCVSSPLLRAGAALSEAQSLQRFAAVAKPAAEAPIQTIDVQTAVKTTNRVFVDLRPPADLSSKGKICGAVSAPFYTQLMEVAQKLKDTDATYIVYASASTPDKPQQAGQVLRAMGISKITALASYEDWVAARAPIEHVVPFGAKQQTAAPHADL